jgi:hypothetical protein
MRLPHHARQRCGFIGLRCPSHSQRYAFACRYDVHCLHHDAAAVHHSACPTTIAGRSRPVVHGAMRVSGRIRTTRRWTRGHAGPGPARPARARGVTDRFGLCERGTLASGWHRHAKHVGESPTVIMMTRQTRLDLCLPGGACPVSAPDTGCIFQNPRPGRVHGHSPVEYLMVSNSALCSHRA